MANYTFGSGTGGVGTSMATESITLTFPTGSSSGPLDSFTLTNPNSACYVQVFNPLASGFTAVTVPAGAGGAILVPPSGNTNTITLKGITGDTGTPLSKTAPTTLIFDTIPPATIGLTAGAAITGFKIYWI